MQARGRRGLGAETEFSETLLDTSGKYVGENFAPFPQWQGEKLVSP